MNSLLQRLFQFLLQRWLHLLSLARRRRLDREMEEEMQFHLEMQLEQNLASGMVMEEARYAAQRRFGNQTWLKEASREMWRLNSIETLIQDLRYGARMLMKQPGFTLIATLTLALGIGTNTTIFSVVNAVWLRPLPYPGADQLALVTHRSPKRGGNFELTPASYFDLRQQNKSFAQLAAYFARNFNLTGTGEPERLQGQLVSAALFPLLKVSPLAGRVFTEADDRTDAPRVVLLGHELWQRRFGADANFIGKTITLDDQSYTVIGVMPPGFAFPTKDTELWAPLALNANAAAEILNRATSLLKAE